MDELKPAGSLDGGDVVRLRRGQLAEQAQTLGRLASLDELTALYNRRGVITVGEQLLYEAPRTGASLGVVFIDLDGLEAINDRCGHRAGDDALQAIGSIIQSITDLVERADDRVYDRKARRQSA